MKKVGVPFTPLRTPLRKSSRTRGACVLVGELLLKALLLESDRRGVFREVSIVERPLMFEEGSVHLAEAPLSRSGFRCFSRMLGMRMYLGEREVPEDETQARTELFLNAFDYRVRTAAVGTLEIAVFDERHGGILGARCVRHVRRLEA